MIQLHPRTVYNCIMPVMHGDGNILPFCSSFMLTSTTPIDVEVNQTFYANNVMYYAEKIMPERNPYTAWYVSESGMFLSLKNLDGSDQLLWLQLNPQDSRKTYLYKNIRWDDEIISMYTQLHESGSIIKPAY